MKALRFFFSSSLKEYFFSASKTKSVPTLCLVFAYLEPGLPRPTIKKGLIDTEDRDYSFDSESELESSEVSAASADSSAPSSSPSAVDISSSISRAALVTETLATGWS